MQICAWINTLWHCFVRRCFKLELHAKGFLQLFFDFTSRCILCEGVVRLCFVIPACASVRRTQCMRPWCSIGDLIKHTPLTFCITGAVRFWSISHRCLKNRAWLLRAALISWKYHVCRTVLTTMDCHIGRKSMILIVYWLVWEFCCLPISKMSFSVASLVQNVCLTSLPPNSRSRAALEPQA